MAQEHKYLAKILRTDEKKLIAFEEQLKRVSGKSGKFKEIVEKNEDRVARALDELGLPQKGVYAEAVYEAMLSHVAGNDQVVRDYLHDGEPSTIEGISHIVALAKKISGVPKGFFLKREIAEKLLKMNPPQHLLKALKLDSIDTLLEEFSLEEVFPAVRFAEDSKWVNTVFFKPFSDLTPDDFEERTVKVVTIPKKFQDITEHFAGKKLHHISHLKELGVIFVMPVEADEKTGKAPVGSVLEVLTLVQHYLHEVPFYSRIFKRFAEQYPDTFTEHLVGALRGDVLDKLPLAGKPKDAERFLIVQRYLAKDDKNDPRLLSPHVNPEAMHWRFVEQKLMDYIQENSKLDFSFWHDLGFYGSDLIFVGKHFPLRSGEAEEFLSFDFIDAIISHNKKSVLSERFVYHEHESLWNALFYAYLTKTHVVNLTEDNLETGYFEVPHKK